MHIAQDVNSFDPQYNFAIRIKQVWRPVRLMMIPDAKYMYYEFTVYLYHN